MRFLRLTMLLGCIFFAASSAFAAETIHFNLVGGTFVGAPQSFFMNPTRKIFCFDTGCTSQIQQLQENPTKGEFSYLGTVVNGTQLIDHDGKFSTSDGVFLQEWPNTDYNATNLFSSGQQITFSLTGVTGISPNPIIFTPGKGWTDDKDNPFTKLSPLPTMSGKIFMGFSTKSDPRASDSLMVIDDSGSMLAAAESLSGSFDLFPVWENGQVTCSAGQYLPTDSYTCTGCPANSWCPGGTFKTYQSTTQGITACTNGLISDAGSSSVEACHTAIPDSVICPAGQYLPIDSSSCVQCPVNSWCPGGNFKINESTIQGLNPCEEGLVSDAGSSNVEDCKTLNTTTCPAGQFLPENSEICTECPANYWCPGGVFQTKDIIKQGINPCEEGLISEIGSSDPKTCFLPPPETTTCAAGQYLPANQSSCTQCPANSWCAGGTYQINQSTNQGITACTSGLISDAGSSNVEACHTALPDSVTCDAGQYLPANSYACTGCPANSWCAGGIFKTNESTNQGITACPNSGISGAGSSAIGSCYKTGLVLSIPNGAGTQTCYWGTVGYTSGCFNYSVTSCTAGYYWAGGTPQCDEVGIGYYSPEGNLEREQCPTLINKTNLIGTTEGTTSANSTSCFIDVPFVSTSEKENGIGKMRCTFRTDSFYGAAESYNPNENKFPNSPNTSDEQCTNLGMDICFGGFFLKIPDNAYCEPVGNGNFSQRPSFSKYIEKDCIAHPEICASEYGYDLSKTEETLGQDTCPNPYVNSEGERNNITTCFKNCSAISVTNSTSVTAVSAKINYGAQDTTCKFNVTCQSGFQPSGSGTATPSCTEIPPETTTCTAGQYLPANQSSCTGCPANSWCAGGTYQLNQSTNQGITACGTGLISAPGSSNVEACQTPPPETTTCAAGQYLPATSSSCSGCPANSWCAGGTYQVKQIANQGITACGTGLISEAGSSNSSACHTNTTTCAAGQYLPANSSSCTGCPANSWCAGGTYEINQGTNQGITACPDSGISGAGSYEIDACYKTYVVKSIQYGSITYSACFWLPDISEYLACSNPQISCNSGYHPSANETTCVENTKETSTCTAGQYLPANSSSCSGCPANSWCAGGTYEINQSTNQGITACGTGLISNAGSSSSSACKTPTTTCTAGQYLAPNSSSCTRCPANSWCAGGTYQQNQSTAQGITTCGTGLISDAGSSSSSACHANTTTCNTGQYLPANSGSCSGCPANSWCAGGTYQINQSAAQGITACGTGLISDAGSSSSSACHVNTTTCAAGQYLPADSMTCTTCVAGNYCPGGTFTQSTSIQGLAACPNSGTSAAQNPGQTGCYKTCNSAVINIPNSASITPVAEKTYWAPGGYPSCRFDVVCSSGYSLQNTSGTMSCVLDEVICNTDVNASAFNSNCEPTKCKFGYRLENKKCLSNRMPCTITNGTGVKEWMGDNVKGGKWTECTASSCEAGYTSDRSLTDEKKPCGICRNMLGANGEVVVSAWKDTNCEIATCMYQGELYRLSNNECIPICDLNGREDDTGTMRWDSISKKCERTCKPGFTSW